MNTRRITNIGSFRAYVERYLRSHGGIHQNMTLIVRQLSPTADGLPLEVYCFTNTVAWTQYGAIQSDIFDHLLAILPARPARVPAPERCGHAQLGRIADATRHAGIARAQTPPFDAGADRTG